MDRHVPVILTAHPLQRIGAYALACLAGIERPDGAAGLPDPHGLDVAGFEAAVAAMTEDAVRAALVRDTKTAVGFFLKCSLSFFPNSKMNHHSNAKRSDDEIAERVRAWRKPRPPMQSGSGVVGCVLCSQPAAGFFGKADVPLAESDLYRNTTPRGHEGMALCWACLCCFYALPYGSWLTGGPSIAVHSWDEDFLASTVAAQVRLTRQVVEIGSAAARALQAREVLALRALRGHQHELTAGVELLVYGNNNRGPVLEVYGLDHALAEWLRRTSQRSGLRRGFRALLRAHRTAREPGYVGLARNAFRSPQRIPGACAAWLATAVLRSGCAERGDEAVALAGLCFDYADKVMLMDKDDLDEIRATGRRIATLLRGETSSGRLREFYARFKDSGRLRSWLQRSAVEWLGRPRDGQDGPLVSTRGFALLFDPDFDNPAWFHRQMLLVAVTEELFRQGWRPEAGSDDGTEELPELDVQDNEFVGDAGRDER
ncbi:hypothetical protein Drose_15085 [Dactylosporangium roseum]|uniref:Type I-B CRISPR-associated protein Cas8b1/Cst1 n=1 Tax=Dactylosporangium roseum TaxID=47989 RepID=A0ABY5ZBF4_9ACTN|nr:hypothetical protein Drose_15085 [Dactylosporangium roseum]